VSNSQNFNISGTNVKIGDISQRSGDGGEDAVKAPQPVRVLFLAANPEGTAALRLDLEIKAISEALSRSRLGERFEIQQSWAAGDRELQDGLLRWQPEIVHLSGHGTREGRFLLEESDSLRDVGGIPHPAPMPKADPQVQALARVFGSARGRIRCVVLNACYSAIVAQAIAQQVGCVVGMSQSVADSAAIRFAWAFYNAIGYGLSVKTAFDIGTAQMGLANLGQENVPRLFSAGVEPATVVFG
jgi:hypothetical protein